MQFEYIVKAEWVMHENGRLENKPWGQREFSVSDPDNNLLTFGQGM